ncbi:uncharacterized protein LOC118201930 isoform X2 [Stegodyphus dumicola]|uniref:uncharacterized protein LOC118201930 isoform X2 n=1 Tax=Stegodyphus dumicola TaxID=202533 RepID=UPI0015B0E0BD|nr:uncharacterized protein LOC118201930 isoform X2 [Stegodyphus dumicola]
MGIYEWDKKKGHYKPEDKEYYTKSKQRFRSVLYKFIRMKHIIKLKSDDKCTKIFRLGENVIYMEELFCNLYEKKGAAECEDTSKDSLFLNDTDADQSGIADLVSDDDAHYKNESVGKRAEFTWNENLANELWMNESASDYTRVGNTVEIPWEENTSPKLPIKHRSCEPLMLNFLKSDPEPTCRTLNEVEKRNCLIIPYEILKKESSVVEFGRNEMILDEFLNESLSERTKVEDPMEIPCDENVPPKLLLKPPLCESLKVNFLKPDTETTCKTLSKVEGRNDIIIIPYGFLKNFSSSVEFKWNEQLADELLMNESSSDYNRVGDTVEIHSWDENAPPKLPIKHPSYEPLNPSPEATCRALNEAEKTNDFVITSKVLVKQNEPLILLKTETEEYT